MDVFAKAIYRIGKCRGRGKQIITYYTEEVYDSKLSPLCPLFAKKGQNMYVKIILLIIIALLLVLDYALVIIAHDAEEDAEQMYQQWKEDRDERSR